MASVVAASLKALRNPPHSYKRSPSSIIHHPFSSKKKIHHKKTHRHRKSVPLLTNAQLYRIPPATETITNFNAVNNSPKSKDLENSVL